MITILFGINSRTQVIISKIKLKLQEHPKNVTKKLMGACLLCY